MNIENITQTLLHNIQYPNNKFNIYPNYTLDELNNQKPIDDLLYPMDIEPNNLIHNNPTSTFIPIIELFKDLYPVDKPLHKMIKFTNQNKPYVGDWLQDDMPYIIIWNKYTKEFNSIHQEYLNEDNPIIPNDSPDVIYHKFIDFYLYKQIYYKLLHWNFDVFNYRCIKDNGSLPLYF